MRRVLTGGIKAVLASAALSTAAHWAMRMQRTPEPATSVATLADPVTTGSIQPRKVERVAPPAAEPAIGALDQQHLMKLIAGATVEKPKAQKVVAKR